MPSGPKAPELLILERRVIVPADTDVANLSCATDFTAAHSIDCVRKCRRITHSKNDLPARLDNAMLT